MKKPQLVDKNTGEVVQATELWGLFITIKNLDGTIVTGEDGPMKDIKLDGYILGEGAVAREGAKKQQEDLAQHYPDKKVIVSAKALERVGPVIMRQMNGLMADSQMNDLVVFYIAEELAKYKSRESLEINPDVTKLAHQIVIDARTAVQQKLIDAIKKRKAAAEGPQLVGPDNQPVSSGCAGNCGDDCECQKSVLGEADAGGPFNPQSVTA
jgi:hypothetical protein